LGIIANSGQHLLSLINDILEISRIEAGRTDLQEDNVSIHCILEEVVSLLRKPARDKGLTIDVIEAVDVPEWITTDGAKLCQILINLVGNAIKFTEEGGVIVRTMHAEDVEGAIAFEVEDCGIGIHKNEQKEIFDAFQQAVAGHMAKGGTGLGLAISREFARLMGGELNVWSQSDRGSVFRLVLPFIAGTPNMVTKKAAAMAVTAIAGGCAPKILIVDDVESNLHLLRAFLNPVGFDIAEATDGEKALEIYSVWKPDLVLMDMAMPTMDGYQATRRTKSESHGSSCPVIAVTAHALGDQLASVIESGVDDVLHKPICHDALLELVASHLGLQYIYDDFTPTLEPECDDAKIAEALAELAGEQLASMKAAATLGALDDLSRQIDVLQSRAPETAAALRLLVDRYELERLAGLFEAACKETRNA
jgi:CheY-like chemotaxis protein